MGTALEASQQEIKSFFIKAQHILDIAAMLAQGMLDCKIHHKSANGEVCSISFSYSLAAF